MRVCAPQVFKATIARGSMGNVAAITAAIKTLKTHDSNGRAELLREAALMVSAANSSIETATHVCSSFAQSSLQ